MLAPEVWNEWTTISEYINGCVIEAGEMSMESRHLHHLAPMVRCARLAVLPSPSYLRAV